MSFGIMSIASSSSGNSYLITNGNTNILLDCGISYKRIKDNLKLRGIDKLNSVLITHEHIDHVKGLKTLIKKEGLIDIYMSEGTLNGIKSNFTDIYLSLVSLDNMGKLHIVKSYNEFKANDILIKPFNVSHDTNEPIFYNFKYLDKELSVVTDTGYVTDEIYESIKKSDLLVIESNHEPNILLYGSYPYKVKQRILSNYGHLSNETCAKCLVRILNEEKKYIKVYLAHLSSENNTPSQAKLTIKNFLEEEGFLIGRDLELETLKKDESSLILYV